MSTLVDSTMINILNHSDSYVSIPTQIKPDGYLFEPSLEEQPFSIPLSFAEIRVVNSQSNIFREGILRFDDELEKEVYEKLGIRDWDQILSDAEIREIILQPTKVGLEKVVKITSSSLLERVRGMLIMLENTGFYDISIRAKNVVNERYKELYSGQRNSDIVITATASDNKNVEQANLASVEDQIAKMREEITAQIRAEFEMKANLEKQIRSEIVSAETKDASIANSASTPRKNARQNPVK